MCRQKKGTEDKNRQKDAFREPSSVRINAAKRLLRDPSLKIGEIGEMVGYADTAHFARVFKKIVGMSANEYRNSHS